MDRSSRNNRVSTPNYKLSVMTVQRVDQSPMNAQRWCLTLSCRHEIWVTAKKKPVRMKAECPVCPPVVIHD